MSGQHISDDDLELYHLGRLRDDEAKLASIEDHLPVCPECLNRAKDTADYINAIRAALEGNVDKEIE